MRAIVTGASGFVGAVLARRLLADGHHVTALLRAGYDPWRVTGLQGALSLTTLDLADRAALAEVVAVARPQWVFHLAASGAYSWQNDLHAMISTNLLATVNLLQACLDAGCEAFVHAGSSSEYGFKSAPPTETEYLEPNSQYAVTKAAATLFCRAEARRSGAPIRILRLYTVYGPFEDPRRLVPTLIVNGLAGRLPPLVNPEVARDMVHVDDTVDALLRAATRRDQEPGAVYNIGTGRQTTIARMVEIAREVLEIAAEPVWGSMPNRSWDTTCWVADARRARTVLGWEPQIRVEEGFRRTAEWLRSSPQILEHYRARSFSS